MKLASGILPVAANTKEICLAWRSPEVREGNRFGIIGGMVHPCLTVEEGALVELGEEMGYYGPVELHRAFVHVRKGFRYHSFIGIVPEPFPFDPEEAHAWETSYIRWMSYPAILEMMKNSPQSFHKGLLELFRESKDLIEKFV